MKLTGWFSQEKIPDTGRTQMPETENPEQVNRQIKALAPGQTIQGEVVSREGSSAQIRLLQDVLIDAKVDADIRLNLGQNITFQVKNNGKVLNLSPLFTNMATEGTVRKALDMASIPADEGTIGMTKQLMDAGLPIDKNTLQQIWHESNMFPQADMEDIINLRKLELPVTESNLTQIAGYRNLTHQLTGGIADTASALTDTFRTMVQNGDVIQAAKLYTDILDLVLPDAENAVAASMENGKTEAASIETVSIETGNAEQAATADLSEDKQAAVQTDPEYEGISTKVADREEAPQLQELRQLLKQGLETGDSKLLHRVLRLPKTQELPEKILQETWSIRPEDVESREKVEQLYQKISRQLKGLASVLEENGQTGSTAYQSAVNLSNNVDFLQQLNQTYAYIQLPLHLKQGEHKTGELFVYTNKKNLAGKDGKISALLHLDMEHLGPLDVYVALQNTKVSTRFYVQNDAILDYLEANMDVLTERLKERGYDCNCETSLRTELLQTAQGLAPVLKTEGSVPIAQYAFDVRT